MIKCLLAAFGQTGTRDGNLATNLRRVEYGEGGERGAERRGRGKGREGMTGGTLRLSLLRASLRF